jgi:hypothetical protein
MKTMQFSSEHGWERCRNLGQTQKALTYFSPRFTLFPRVELFKLQNRMKLKQIFIIVALTLVGSSKLDHFHHPRRRTGPKKLFSDR